ncbi:hypothetical protein, partial [Nocardia sp. NPDC005366]|uniref:hypothetical protein n=1 Tax=Nocardia sp. NPDC005366 TaxID=3156878 RepID=UPI0033BAEC13
MSNRSPDPKVSDAHGRSDTETVSGPRASADRRKDPRGYITLSVDFLENHRTGPLSPVTKLTLIELWIYCHRNRTNGTIPAAQAHRLVHKRVREVLTAAGCWHQRACTPSAPCALGACSASASCGRQVYALHDYDKHQLRYTATGDAALDDPLRDRRPYIKLAVDFLDNHRTGPLSPVAKLALLDLWIYCHTNRTNGVVPLSAFRRIATPRIRAMLIKAGSCHHDADVVPPSRHHDADTVPTSRRHED